jgi:hypothetical protein
MLLLAASSAWGEETPDEAGEVANTLIPGQPIRLVTPMYGEITGLFRRNTTDSLYVDSAPGLHSLSLSEVDGLWVRGNSLKPGLLIGGVVGFLALAGYAGGEDEKSGGQQGAVLTAGVVGGILGSFVGSMVGLAVPRWELKYRSPRQIPDRESPRFAAELLVGHALDHEDPLISGRLLLAGTPRFRLGVEYVQFGDANSDQSESAGAVLLQEDERHTKGFSFFCGPSLVLKKTQPYVLFGVSILNEEVSVSRREWDASSTLIDRYEHHDSDRIFGLVIGPGVRIGEGRWRLVAEGRYQMLAQGYYDELFAVVGGISYNR